MALRVRRNRSPRKFRLHKAPWVDPYPHIPGTEPEKRIFAALMQLRIFFYYGMEIEELLKGTYVSMDDPEYVPDFVIPEHKIIIDPFSPFHHSLPDAVERDWRKARLYTAMGYQFIHPWAMPNGVFLMDQDVLALGGKKIKVIGERHAEYHGALELISSIPGLFGPPKFKLSKLDQKFKQSQGYRFGRYVGLGSTSVAAANAARKRPGKLSLSRGTRSSIRRRPLK